jgi:hypothetical protein
MQLETDDCLNSSSANREWTPMHANRGTNTLIASDSRLFALIRGFRLNHHAALTFAERGQRRGQPVSGSLGHII